jgi:hypothetical protein
VIAMPMVFISHSSREDAFAQRVCAELQAAIRQRQWEPFIDVTAFQGGEEWQGILYSKLEECDAAIILLGRAAMESPWVRREVFMLLWRRALGSPVTLLPVLLGDVTMDEIKRSDLAELEHVQFAAAGAAGGPDQARELAATIAAALPDAGTALPASGPMRRWLEDVVYSLRQVDSPDTLRQAARELDPADTATFATLPESRRYLAHQLLGSRPQQPLHKPLHNAVVPLHNAVVVLARRGADLPGLVALVKPSWVDPDAARRLLPGAGRVAALLNARRSETARQYVQRASCCSLNFLTQSVSLISGEDQQGQFRSDCLTAIRAALFYAADDPLDGAEPAASDVVFLIIDPGDGPVSVIAETLPGLLAEFPWLNVIVLTGEAGPAGTPPDGLTGLSGREIGAVVLRPRLGPNEEREGGQIVGRLDQILEDVGAR